MFKMKVCVGLLVLLNCLLANSQTYFYARYNDLGCWVDKIPRAIPTLEGSSSILNGNDAARCNAVLKCARVAADNGHEVFAVQNGGWCASSSTAELTYEQYGKSNKCKNDGKGGPFANQVYELTYLAKVVLEPLGCWRDTNHRAIRTLEGLDSLLDSTYAKRANAIEKCARAAMAKGYSIIGIQHGGWCAGSRYAEGSYRRYGVSTSCRPGGKGGPWANNVYRLNTVWERSFPAA